METSERRHAWLTKTQTEGKERYARFIQDSGDGAKRTIPLLEHAIATGCSGCAWAEGLYNKENALAYLRKEFPDFILDWWTGQPRITIK